MKLHTIWTRGPKLHSAWTSDDCEQRHGSSFEQAVNSCKRMHGEARVLVLDVPDKLIAELFTEVPA